MSIADFKKVNKIKGVDFSKLFKALVDKYNDWSEQDILRSEVSEDFTDEIINLHHPINQLIVIQIVTHPNIKACNILILQ
jgi:type I restriction enzyme, R subunit